MVVGGLYAGEFGDGSPVRNTAAIRETDDAAGTNARMAESRSKAKTYLGAALAERGEELDVGNERVGLGVICLILFGCHAQVSINAELVLTKYLLNR